ncbi:MAG: peptide deformylase [Lachnospiraceae bacterium]|nr:peptide deformylase [Lachnospiraceae bacterium]
MALRQIRVEGDPVLNKVSKEVKEVTPRTLELIGDMLDTMYEANGVGLAAPQVGILKRIVVIDVTGDEPHVLINPRIVEADGEQTGYEGCLSVPGMSGKVSRPDHVKAVYYNEQMELKEIEGTELMARAICHELDHLDGHMYTEKVIGELVSNEELAERSEEDNPESEE